MYCCLLPEDLDQKLIDLYGAKLLEVGGGGFPLMVPEGVEHSWKIREILEKRLLNDGACFFGFSVAPEGAKVNMLYSQFESKTNG